MVATLPPNAPARTSTFEESDVVTGGGGVEGDGVRRDRGGGEGEGGGGVGGDGGEQLMPRS